MQPFPKPLAGLVCAALAACGGAGRGLDGGEHGHLVHLDPRLPDGSSSTAALEAEDVLVRRFTLSGPESVGEDLAPWTFDNSLFLPTESGPGCLVRAREYLPAEGVVHARMDHPGPLQADEVNLIELDLVSLHSGNATLTWRCESAPAGVLAGSLRVDANTTQGALQTVRLSMVGHPGWRGSIERLRLYPCWKGPQAYELREVRLMRSSFARGAQPSAQVGDAGGDAGLLGAGPDKRRSWPSDDGVQLFERLSLPPDAHLVVDVSRAVGARSAERATFAVDARPTGEPGADWSEVGRLELEPAMGTAWRTLQADLEEWSGLQVELRLRSWFGAPEPAPGAAILERGELLWGAPTVSGPREADPRPNLLLVTLDTLRSDALGCYGGPDDTPYLDALAAEGMRFSDTWTACNSTLPSHVSILTGLPVPSHGVLDNRSTLAPEVRTVVQALREAGYLTAAAVSVEHLQPSWSGLGRGFDQFLEVIPGATVDGALTLGGLEGWMDGLAAGGGRPFFLWVHLFDVHTPYGPPAWFMERFEASLAQRGEVPPQRTADPPTIGRTSATRAGEFLAGVSSAQFPRHLYRAGVAYTDELVRRLAGQLQGRGLWRETAVVVTSDHGEALGEHDVWYNHQRVHPPVMSVPLILRVPRGPSGVTCAARASTADVARTLLVLGRAESLEPGGVDLLELCGRSPERDRRIWFTHSHQAQVGCRDGDIHYFHNLTEFLQLGRERREAAGLDFLYRHGPDPSTRSNLAQVEPELAARYQEAMRAWLARVEGGRRIEATIDAAEEARLKAMGYGGGDDGE